MSTVYLTKNIGKLLQIGILQKCICTHTHTRSLSLFSHLYFHFYLDAKNSGRDYDVLCFDPNTVENYSKSVWIISHVICTNTVFQLMFNECVECACAYVFVCVQTSVWRQIYINSKLNWTNKIELKKKTKWKKKNTHRAQEKDRKSLKSHSKLKMKIIFNVYT